MPLPNFFIIGAAKSGTTALYHILKQHPEIFMSPIKEPRFFAYAGAAPVFDGPLGKAFQPFAVWQPQDYLHLFSAVTNETAIGEASVTYLHSAQAAQRISQQAPNSKIIAILRQPADRSYSQYCYAIARGEEQATTFAAALAEEDAGLRATWGPILQHKAASYYGKHLAVYYELFPREQIKVYLHEDFTRNTQWLVRDLFEFLGVDPGFSPQVQQKT